VHTPVTAERPVVAQYEPVGQAVQELEPTFATKVPAAQLVQVEADATAYVPTRQDEQIVADAAEYIPEMHVAITAERPVVAQ